MHSKASKRYFSELKIIEENVGKEASFAMRKIIDDMLREYDRLNGVRSSIHTLRGVVVIQALILTGMAFAFSRYHPLGTLLSDFVKAIGASLAALIGIMFLGGAINSWRTQRKIDKPS